jgi:hypothetical protein
VLLPKLAAWCRQHLKAGNTPRCTHSGTAAAATAADPASPLLRCLTGMMCALAGAGTWMIIATYLELPVSSTQSIVSSIAGM